jgi:hypothetical protein
MLALVKAQSFGLDYGQRCCSATSGVGSAALCSYTCHAKASPDALSVGWARWFLCSAFRRTKILDQIAQHCVAVGVRDHSAEAFHFFQLRGPLLASQVLLGNAAGVMTLRTASLDFRLHRPRRKRLAGSARRLRARRHGGCEKDYCGGDSLEQGQPSTFKFSTFECARGLYTSLFFLALIEHVDG